MSKLKQAILFFGMAIIMLSAGIFLRGEFQSEPTPSEANKRGVQAIFASTLTDVNGESQAISQWKGKVLIVNFWATWCAPCREEIPEFMEMHAEYQDQGLQFIGIAIDSEDKVIAYNKEFGINYPILIGGLGGMTLAEATGNAQGALPYTIVINKDGVITNTFLGRVHQKRLEKVFKPLLKAG